MIIGLVVQSPKVKLMWKELAVIKKAWKRKNPVKKDAQKANDIKGKKWCLSRTATQFYPLYLFFDIYSRL